MQPIRWPKILLSAFVVGALVAVLTAHAALVQGAGVELAWAGGLIGTVCGAALATGQASPRFVGAVVGSLLGLQFIRVNTCDGSLLHMPGIGAIMGGLAGWMAQSVLFGNRQMIKSSRPLLSLILPPLMACGILGAQFVGSSTGEDSRNATDENRPLLRDAEKWLGPQKSAKLDMVDSGEIEDLYKIELEVISGEALAGVKNLQNTVHWKDSVTEAPANWQQNIDKNAKYVFGRIRRKGASGLMIYTLDCRIEKGPLTGAIVHLRNGKTVAGDREYSAFYRVPNDIDVEVGPIEFKVVRRFWK
ncbi:MAG: hypothetical protein JSS02_07760 [Planctomycetes bacterium]|nr:hypothetical protein [Planctomycetota bacterium]